VTQATVSGVHVAGARRQAAWQRLLPFALAAALMAFVLARIEWSTFVKQVASVGYLGFFAFIVVFVACLLLADTLATAFVYRTIVRVSFRDLFIVRSASYLPSLLNYHVGQAWLTYLLSKKYQVPLGNVVGATLFAYVTWGGCVLCLAAVGLAGAGFSIAWLSAPLLLGIAYLGVLWWRPARLARTFLAPLFDAGPRGHLHAMALRIPHLAVLFVGTWIPFYFFGIDIPPASAITYMPVLMVVVALPLTPVGLGTRDVLAAQFFADFVVAGGSLEQRHAALAASTTTIAVALTAVEAVVGLVALRWASGLVPPAEAEPADAGSDADAA
jgi:hypothetical protein